ncbi:unnamed protein product [Phytomonas sp. EM1]|nr:unnamed protein product [Phytomonas sp. EM1]|eukprot:CCW60119.1 unnamed protein product [Phytomonas sp. isolate EM1]
MATLLKPRLLGLLLCTLWIFCLPLHASGHVIEDFDKVLIHVLHRHGARAPTAKPNQTMFCTDAPCDQLTENGVRMMEEVGKFLSKMYSVGPNPLFPKASDAEEMDGAVAQRAYNLHDVYSRSTDVDRTIQSAIAFLRGFFMTEGSSPSFSPVIHTVPKPMDTLLLTYLQPNLGFYYRYHRATLLREVNPVTDKLFLDWKSLTRISTQLGLKGVCDNWENRTECAFNLFDIAASMTSSGEIDAYPLLKQNYKKLQRIYRALLDYESYFDYNKEQHRREGSRGYIYWKQVLRNIDEKISGNISFKMIHYSAHDITLTPITGSLLDRSDLGMLPPFGQTLVVELLKLRSPPAGIVLGDDKAASVSSDAKNKLSKANYSVRVLRGNPAQTPEENFVFHLDSSFQLRCANSSGRLYNATDNICPLEDFERMLEKGAPTDPRGSCLLEEELVKVVNCPEKPVLGSELEGDLTRSVAVSPICAAYRKQCPEAACMGDEGAKGILDLKTLLCVDNHVTKIVDNEPLNKPLTVIVPLILFAVGLGVAIILGVKCLSVKRPKINEVGDP